MSKYLNSISDYPIDYENLPKPNCGYGNMGIFDIESLYKLPKLETSFVICDTCDQEFETAFPYDSRDCSSCVLTKHYS